MKNAGYNFFPVSFGEYFYPIVIDYSVFQVFCQVYVLLKLGRTDTPE